MITKDNLRVVSKVMLALGFISIFGSMFTFLSSRSGKSHEELAKAQGTGMFLGLWPPTFFILSNALDRWADHV